MTRTVAAPLDTAAASHPRLGALLAAKVRLLAPLTILYVTAYVGLTALAGFGRPVMAAKVAGPLNLGLCLILFNYALAWSLAIIYVRVANRTYDPEVDQLRATVGATKSRR